MPASASQVEIDVISQVIHAFIANWPLLLGLGAVVKWGFPWVVKAVMPDLVHDGLKSYFANGGGDSVRAIVKSENEAQSIRTKEAFDLRLKEHEKEEKERFAAGEQRFRDLESDVRTLHEVSDSWRLTKPKRNRQRKER